MPNIFVSPSHDPSEARKRGLRKVPLLSQILSSFIQLPQDIRFETQNHQEIIILFLRKHFITNVPWIFITILLIALPSLLFPVLLSQSILVEMVPASFITFLFVAWYLFTFSYALINFLLWYFTVSIVTDQRIIDIDFVNILYKEFSATTIEKIEDVTDRRGGFFGVVFDYGDVIIQTAAAQVEFDFLSIPHPDQVVRIINELMREKKEHE